MLRLCCAHHNTQISSWASCCHDLLQESVERGYKQGKEVMYDFEEKINIVVFPGLQDGPHNHTITRLTVALKQATTGEYKAYQEQVLSNCSKFAQTLMKRGYELVSGGNDNHLVLLNLKPKGIDGSRVEKVLEAVYRGRRLISNKANVYFGQGAGTA
ncbi:serine hydroxymethyltransferase 1, mitochondrial-like [Apium graveolens]|uniref:serine hydroxymethyltransferase 1, mitochondrial-like n=1 Tax=Apium graveolens TaxID=4045 RepID=UPI003D797781